MTTFTDHCQMLYLLLSGSQRWPYSGVFRLYGPYTCQSVTHFYV